MLRSRALRTLFRDTLIRTPLEQFIQPGYPYLFTPAQLFLLCEGLQATQTVAGDICEIGCFRGGTTIFLNTHLSTLSDTRRYLALDTFQGFSPSSVQHEEQFRGKDRRRYSGFAVNKKAWMERLIRKQGFTRVEVVEADIVNSVPIHIDSISFCLIDVDLYLPVQAALKLAYPLLSPGGLIFIDDCVPEAPFDGAYQAYTEFCQMHELQVDIRAGKLGVIVGN